MHVEDDICNRIPWYHLNWINKSHLFRYRKIPIPYPLTAEPGLPTAMFSIPLASPFCIFYRTGLTPYPSSLNASNIRTLLAHRFHLLKLLVIINYIFIFVKHNSLTILYKFPSLILVKKALFFVHFEHISTLILLVTIYFFAFSLLVILSLLV